MFSRCALVTVLVNNYDAAITFYKNVGFKLVKDVAYGEGSRWVEFALGEDPKLPKLNVRVPSAEYADAMGRQGTEGPLLVLEVPDVLQYHAMLTAKGVFADEPKEDHGRVGFLLVDPSKNQYFIREEKSQGK